MICKHIVLNKIRAALHPGTMRDYGSNLKGESFASPETIRPHMEGGVFFFLHPSLLPNPPSLRR